MSQTIKKATLALLSISFIGFLSSCDEDTLLVGDGNSGQTANTIEINAEEIGIDHVVISYGTPVSSGGHVLYLDQHNGTAATAPYTGSFFLFANLVSSDSTKIAAGHYHYMPMGMDTLNHFRFVEFRNIVGADTNLYSCSDGHFDIHASTQNGTYDYEFELDMVHDTDPSKNVTITGNYTGSTSYFGIKPTEVE